MMARIVYIVSDLAKGFDKVKTPYWRPTAMVSCITAAKAWANPNYSIVTEHTFEEGSQILKTKTMPTDYKIVG